MPAHRLDNQQIAPCVICDVLIPFGHCGCELSGQSWNSSISCCIWRTPKAMLTNPMTGVDG
eukprot:scaffold100479_cov11-Prasinocladus_malaysianus.AAC.1